MYRKLAPLLILLISNHALAYEPPIEVTEYFDSARIFAHIDAAETQGMPSWQPFEQAPPLSIDAALKTVQDFIKTNDKASDAANAKLLGIELKQMSAQKPFWHYIVKVKYKTGEESAPHLFMVLMNGKVFPALKYPSIDK